MAGVTDVAFRERLARSGCRAQWTEMVSAAAVVRNHRATHGMLHPPDFSPDLVLQIFGSKPDELSECARVARDIGWARLDLNFGCPVKKVVRTGAGAALSRTPLLAAALVCAVRRAFSGVLTVKFRLGWSEEEVNFLEMGRIFCEEGADGVILHGRTRAQGYSGEADWGAISKLAASLPIPVAGNGDVRSGEEALSRLRESGVAAVMIGRAALGNPALFGEAEALREGTPPPHHPTPAQVAEELSVQFLRLAELKGERVAVAEMKKFLAWADKGRVGAPERRARIVRAKVAGDIRTEIAILAGLPPLDSTGEVIFDLEAEPF